MNRQFLVIISNPVLSTLILILTMAAGTMALAFMHRELFPDFSMDEILVEMEYPGASPSEIQDGIIRKIEDALEGMEGVGEYVTSSEDNRASAEIMVRHGYDATTLSNRIRSRVDAISTFPASAERPVINVEQHRTEVMRLYVAADLPERQRKELARSIGDELRGLPAVSQVKLLGVRDYEIGVELSEERLRGLGLGLQDVSHRIASQNLERFGGYVRTDDRNIRIRTLGRKLTARDMSTIPILASESGSLVTLGYVAEIRDEFTEDSVQVAVNGRPAIVFVINKTRAEDALRISRSVREYMHKKQSQLPEHIDFNILYDMTEDLRSRMILLVRNGIAGLCLVTFLLWLFLDPRLSFRIVMGILFSIFGTLAAVWCMGGTINMLSLFGLIMVLGIVADDAIVVGENIHMHLVRGVSPPEAALKGIREVGGPVFAAVLTTVLAFIPLVFIGDTIGKFLRILPLVVIPCLCISLLESLLLLPVHLVHNQRPRKKNDRESTEIPLILKPLWRLYDRTKRLPDLFATRLYPLFLENVLPLRYVWLSGGLCALMLCAGLYLSGHIKIETLPDTGGRLFTASVAMNNGTSERMTRQAVSRIEQGLLRVLAAMGGDGYQYGINRMSIVGSSLSEEPENGSHLGGVQVILGLGENGVVPDDKLLDRWERAIGTVDGVESIVFESIVEGPPGEPVVVWIRGQDTEALTNATRDITARLRTIPGIRRIRSDLSTRVDELRCTLKPEAAHLGITLEGLAGQVRAAFYGVEPVRLQRGRDEVRIKVRYTGKERTSIGSLDSLRIRAPNGVNVPLRSVADVSLAKGESIIRRVNGMRCMTVTADVDNSIITTDEILAYLERNLTKDLEAESPGLDISFEGEERHMEESLHDLAIGYALALLGIFFVIATMFRSYAQPMLILLTIPFGIAGAVAGHFIADCNISLMSLFGIVALSGIGVNDTIVFIERINKNLIAGMEFFQAIKNAGQHRFRAILLTTVSTLGGLAPLLLEPQLSARILKPMALAISSGLLMSTVATLVFIPCMFAALSDLRMLLHRIRTGRWAPREELEPSPARYDILLEHRP